MLGRFSNLDLTHTQVTLAGVVYDCEYAIEERGYPSNGWDDPGSATIISVFSINGEGCFQPGKWPLDLVEKLEEMIGELYDLGEMDYDDY